MIHIGFPLAPVGRVQRGRQVQCPFQPLSVGVGEAGDLDREAFPQPGLAVQRGDRVQWCRGQQPSSAGAHVLISGRRLAGVPVAASAGIPALGLADGAAVAFRPESPDDLGRALAATRACTDAARRRGEELRRDYPDADTVAAVFVKLVAAAARGDRTEAGGQR